MNAFLDTSALLKLYHREDGTERIELWLEENAENIFVSELAKLEFRSAIWKKVRMNEFDSHTGESVIACFENDYDFYDWIKLDEKILQSASDLLMEYGQAGLRTLDSLQLASALSLRSSDCMYISFDNLLNTFSSNEELIVFTE